MNTHQTSSTQSPKPATVAPHAAMASNEPEQHFPYSAWTTRRKPTIADLIDDPDALADWHRNLARLRADLKN